MNAQPKLRALTPEVIRQCKQRLLESKAEIMNRVRDNRQNLANDEKGGDEGDQTVRLMAESDLLNAQDRMRRQLQEIEMALGRIEKGIYGVCEETEEPIEVDRLIAIPWTRLSIEGAEMRETVDRRYAR